MDMEAFQNTVPLYLYFGSMMSLRTRTHSLLEILTRVKWNITSTTRQRALGSNAFRMKSSQEQRCYGDGGVNPGQFGRGLASHNE